MDGFGLLLMDTRVGDSNWFKRTQSARYPRDISVIERDEWEIRVKRTQKCKFALILRGSKVSRLLNTNSERHDEMSIDHDTSACIAAAMQYN
jgi:hypothetical protein